MRKRIFFSFALLGLFLFCSCDSQKKQSADSSPGPAALSTEMDADLEAIQVNFPIDNQGARVGIWTSDYKAAISLAKEKELPIILNFTGSDWCKYCKYLVRDVFSKTEWQAWAVDKFVMVYLDFPRDPSLSNEELMQQNIELREKYQIEAFPSILLLDSDESLLGFVEMREDNSVHTFQRNLKSLNRRRKSVIKKMLAELPESNRAEITATYDKIEANRKKIEETAKKYEEMAKQYEETLQNVQKEIVELSEKTEQALMESIVARLSAEDKEKYKEAKTKLEQIQNQLDTWLSGAPENTETNRLLFKTYQRQLQEQSDIIADLIDPN